MVTIIGIQVSLKLNFRYRLSLREEELSEIYHRLSSLTAAPPLEKEIDPIGQYNILVQSILDVARSLIPEGKVFPRSCIQGGSPDPPPW